MILYLFHLYDNNTQATFTPTPSQPHRNLTSHNLLLTNIQYNSILTIWCLIYPSLFSHIIPKISSWLWTGRSWAKSTRTEGWCSIALPAWWRGKKNANWKLLSSHHCPPEATISSFPTKLPPTNHHLLPLLEIHSQSQSFVHLLNLNADDDLAQVRAQLEQGRSPNLAQMRSFSAPHAFLQGLNFHRAAKKSTVFPLIGAADWGKNMKVVQFSALLWLSAFLSAQLQHGLGTFSHERKHFRGRRSFSHPAQEVAVVGNIWQAWPY